MKTTELLTPPQAAEEPSFGDELAEFLPWIAAIVVLAPITLLSLVLWAPFLLLFAVVVAPVAAVGLLGVGVAILATPFLFIRHRRQHAVERARSAQRSIAIPGAVAQAGGAQ
jgi:hypothetical protein